MRNLGPNMAARPFANERPAKRTTLLIWVLALTLLAVNAFLYQRHLSDHYEQRQSIESLQDRIEQERAAIAQAESDLATLQLDRQNERVVFLNGQIARRTFSWSRLFDRLEEVLPANVQLDRVSPQIVREYRRRGSSRQQDDTQDLVLIDLRGDAQTGDELLRFVDSLFEHRSFTLPDLKSEGQRDDGRQEFAISVLYLPAAIPIETPETAPDEAEEPSPDTEPTGGAG